MNLRLLGLCALFGAPFLLVDMLANGTGASYEKTASSGLYSVLYISGWMCSIIGLWQTEAAGANRWGRVVLLVQLLLLSLANVSNLMLLLQVGTGTKLFFVLDLFWPISNIWMLATGITVLVARRLQGWMRVVPLVVGLWLPVCLLFFSILMGGTPASVMVSGVYSTIAWILLAAVVLRLDGMPSMHQRYATA